MIWNLQVWQSYETWQCKCTKEITNHWKCLTVQIFVYFIHYITELVNCTPNPCQNNGTCNKSGNSFNCTCKQGYNGPVCDNSKYHASLIVVIHLKAEQRPLLNVLFVKTSFSFSSLQFRYVTKGYIRKQSNKIEPAQDFYWLQFWPKLSLFQARSQIFEMWPLLVRH